MSLGILGQRSLRGTAALGATPPPAAWCWKAAGYPWGAAFDTCHAGCYQFCVQQKRWPGTEDGDACVYGCDRERCDCPTSRPTTAPKTGATTTTTTGSPLVMGNKSSDPRVAGLQSEINATLTRNGYAAIGTDGKLGPGTCGAAREADKFGAGLMAKYGLASVCTSFTTPVKSGGGFVSPGGGGGGASLAPPDTLSSGTLLGMDTKTVLLVAGIGIAAWAFLGKKKPGAGK
jgi:hypothetical protein